MLSANGGFSEDLAFFKCHKNKSLQNKNLINSEKTAIGYDDFWVDYTNSIDNCSIFIGAEEIQTSKISLKSNGCDFLNFAELAIFNEEALNNFIKNHGFLTNEINNKMKVSDFDSVKNSNNEQCKKKIKYLRCEPFSIWPLFQWRLQTLIRVWRSFSTKSEIFKKFYRQTLYDKGFITFKDIMNSSQLYKVEAEDFNFNPSPAINLKQFNEKNLGSEIANLKFAQMPSVKWIDDYVTNFEEKFLEDSIKVLTSKIHPTFSITNIKNATSLLGKELSDEKKITLSYQSLMDNLIIQFVEAICNKTEFQKCLECQTWMPKTSWGGKPGDSGKSYCSSQCRNNAYRRRNDVSLFYDLVDQNGPFSVKNIINAFLPSDNTNEIDFFDDYVSKISNKTRVKRILRHFATNLTKNFLSGVGKKKLAEHLGIKEQYLPTFEDKDVSVLKYFNKPYIDWNA